MAFAGILPKFGADEPDRPHAVAAMLSPKRGGSSRAEALADAEERGFQNGFAAAREEDKARRDQAEAEWERRLKDERARWIAEEAATLADGWKTMLAGIETRLADTTAGLLAPLVGTALASKAAAELSAAVADLLAQDTQKIIRVSGPSDLLDLLKARLGEAAGSIEFIPGGRAELKLVAGDTIFETQLEPWSRRLAEAIGGTSHG